MKEYKRWIRVLSAVLALLLLCGCAAGGQTGNAGGSAEPEKPSEPENTGEPETPGAPLDDGVVRVSTVDELLAAIAPNTTIELAAGTYDLSKASTYGKDSGSDWYSWDCFYGDEASKVECELQIQNVDGLTLRGAGMGETIIRTAPRFANIIFFGGCRNIHIENLTAGHTKAPGICSGGVLRFQVCSQVTVDGCGLYGCGTVGVYGFDCSNLSITNTQIYECSYEAVDFTSCHNVRMDGCEIYHHGIKGDSVSNLFSFITCDGVTVMNCQIRANATQKLLFNSFSQNVVFLCNKIENNMISDAAFSLHQYPVTVDGCTFTDNEIYRWFDGVNPTDAAGNSLEDDTLQAMQYREIDPADVSFPELYPGLDVPVGGEVTVATVDELLAAIGPDRTILLDGERFDLTEAAGYGKEGGVYYFWQEVYDGWTLVINGVSGLTIQAKSENPAATSLVTSPRFADVLAFQNCKNISLAGFTAGHTNAPGTCSGGVLSFQYCRGIGLESCRLYGCGIMGVTCDDCSDFQARDCEIYDCTFGGVSMNTTRGIRFENCNIHDVPSPAVSIYSCEDVVWNETTLSNGAYDIDEEGKPGEQFAQEGAKEVKPKVYWGDMEVEEFTVRKGDCIRLDALIFPLSDYAAATFTWTAGVENALQLAPSTDGKYCDVTALLAIAGGVKLTVESGGKSTDVWIFILE